MSFFSKNGIIIGTVFTTLCTIFGSNAVLADNEKTDNMGAPLPKNPTYQTGNHRKHSIFSEEAQKGKTDPPTSPSEELLKQQKRFERIWDKIFGIPTEEPPNTDTTLEP